MPSAADEAGATMGSIKLRIQTILKRAGFYHRLRNSRIHDFYWMMTGRRWMLARTKQIDFYRHLLSGLRYGDLIFDIGANEGFKTDVFLRLGARVVAVEPDETNQLILRESFAKFRFTRKPLIIIGKAVSDTTAVETMWVDGPGSAVNTLSQKWATTLKGNKTRHTMGHCGLDFTLQKTVETTTLEELIAAHGLPIFIKIDVEGYELNVVRGLQRPVAYLSFEVNLPEFRSEGLQCVQTLQRLATAGQFNYAVDCEEGLAFERWLTAEEFLRVFEQCREKSIEVFWKGLANEVV